MGRGHRRPCSCFSWQEMQCLARDRLSRFFIHLPSQATVAETRAFDGQSLIHQLQDLPPRWWRAEETPGIGTDAPWPRPAPTSSASCHRPCFVGPPRSHVSSGSVSLVGLGLFWSLGAPPSVVVRYPQDTVPPPFSHRARLIRGPGPRGFSSLFQHITNIACSTSRRGAPVASAHSVWGCSGWGGGPGAMTRWQPRAPPAPRALRGAGQW